MEKGEYPSDSTMKRYRKKRTQDAHETKNDEKNSSPQPNDTSDSAEKKPSQQ